MKLRLIVTGMLALFMLGSILPANEKNSGKVTTKGSYTLIKGRLEVNSEHGTWSYLSFGVVSDRGTKCKVNNIEITDLYGHVLVVTDDFESDGEDGITWYHVPLERYDLPFEFLTRIHIASRGGGITLLKQGQSDAGSPIDPDETIVVVKWP